MTYYNLSPEQALYALTTSHVPIVPLSVSGGNFELPEGE